MLGHVSTGFVRLSC